MIHLRRFRFSRHEAFGDRLKEELLRGYLHQTGTNSNRYEMFATVYMKPGRNAWCLASEQNDLFCQIKISLTQKHTGLKFLDPV